MEPASSSAAPAREPVTSAEEQVFGTSPGTVSGNTSPGEATGWLSWGSTNNSLTDVDTGLPTRLCRRSLLRSLSSCRNHACLSTAHVAAVASLQQTHRPRNRRQLTSHQPQLLTVLLHDVAARPSNAVWGAILLKDSPRSHTPAQHMQRSNVLRTFLPASEQEGHSMNWHTSLPLRIGNRRTIH